MRVLAHQRVEEFEQVLGDAFAGGVGQHVELEKICVGFGQGQALCIALGNHTSVVQMQLDPVFQVTQATKVDHEAALVGFAATKGDDERPVVPVDEVAMAFMLVLAMGERDVRVDFFTGKHGRKDSKAEILKNGKADRDLTQSVSSRWRRALQRWVR